MTYDPRTLAIFGILAMLILVASAIVASAEHAANYQGYRPAYIWNVHEWREVNRRRRFKREPLPTYRPREEGRCWPFLVAVGEQHVSLGGAQEKARDMFSATARWRIGERAMDFNNARDATYECSRSSVGSVVGQVFYRCEVKARPCRAELKGGD
jgi:hypothetical protein